MLLLLPLVSADLVVNPAPRGFMDIIISLLINLVINSIVLALLVLAFKNFRTKTKVNYIWRVLAITIIGQIIDLLVLYSGYGEPMTIVQGLMVLVLVGITSYSLVFKQTLKIKQAIIAAIIFGIISNPFWLALFRL